MGTKYTRRSRYGWTAFVEPECGGTIYKVEVVRGQRGGFAFGNRYHKWRATVTSDHPEFRTSFSVTKGASAIGIVRSALSVRSLRASLLPPFRNRQVAP